MLAYSKGQFDPVAFAFETRSVYLMSLFFNILGFHHRFTGAATFGRSCFALQSETFIGGSLSSALGVTSATRNNETETTEKENTMKNPAESRSNEKQKSNPSIDKWIIGGLLMVTLVRRAGSPSLKVGLPTG